MSDVTVTNDPPMANSPEARTPDGTLIDRSPPPTTTPTSSTTTPTPPKETPTDPEGSTFLTGKKPDARTDNPTDPKPTDKDPGEKTPETQGAPEKYADFKVPDGFKFDDKVLTEATAVFKELNLSQDAAQKLIDINTKHLSDLAKAPYDLWATTQSQWHDQILERFGGETGAAKMNADVNKVINTVLPPSLRTAFRTAMDFTGAGSNPDILEAYTILFKPHMEGRPVPGGGPSGEANKDPARQTGPIDPAAAMYPHLVKNRPQ